MTGEKEKNFTCPRCKAELCLYTDEYCYHCGDFFKVEDRDCECEKEEIYETKSKDCSNLHSNS
jgi:hypothetical protein